MSKLNAAKRNALPEKDFAVPGRHYPVPDESHAKAALSMVSRYGTTLEKELVRRKVHERYPDMGE